MSYTEHTKQSATGARTTHVFFIVVLGLVFLLTFGFLYGADLTPELVLSTGTDTTLESDDVQVTLASSMGPTDDRPDRIIAEAIDLDATLVNPESRDISILDEALRHGIVHYPGSGDLEDTSNMLLFGHSSSLPNIQNEWYKVFNNLSKLKQGDIVRVQADGYEYRYSVTSVELVDASEALIELSNREKKLTISTCNSFGAKTERFVVEATFLDRVQLGGQSSLTRPSPVVNFGIAQSVEL